MSAPTAYEQLILELINRARLDPNAEASRLGISLNKDLSPGQISGDSKQPLAYNSTLNNAAAGHSNWMLANDVFSHTGAGGSDPGDRMAAAGYQFSGNWTWGENIAWNGTTGTLNVLQAAHSAHDGLFDSAGHRLNILNDNFKEIGVGAEIGNYRGYNAFMLTENFAKSGSGSFITGVAYSDNNGDSFYSIGEGRGGVNVSFREGSSGLGSTSTWSAGGYALETTETGNITVTFSGGGLPAAVTATVVLANENVKVDLIGTNRIESSVTTTLGQNATTLELLGLDNISGTGNGLNNTIIGNAGRNSVKDAGGNDYVNLGSGNDYVLVGGGIDTFFGGSGKDYISYYNSGGVRLDLAANTASGSWAVNDTISSFESASGSKTGNDIIHGTSGSNVIRTYGGNDKIYDRGGDDYVDLGAGNDYVLVGGGVDTFVGGSGKDYISYYNSGGVRLDLAANTASGSWAVNDTISSFESASGSKTGNDTIQGTNGPNVIRTYGGNDHLHGRGGNDVLAGGAGADQFYFAFGDDKDRIADFENNIDTLVIEGFDVISNSTDALSYARQSGNDVVFDFGMGDVLTVEEISISAIADDVDVLV